MPSPQDTRDTREDQEEKAEKAEAQIFYGPETTKALHTWGAGQTPRALIRAYCEVKLAALRAQQSCAKLYSPKYFSFLEQSCAEIIAGQHDAQFPLPLEQGGAGTSLHMNICEVISGLSNEYAERAGLAERSHPLDDIARFQSTNDTLATALTILCYRGLLQITEGVIKLQEALNQKELAWEQVPIMGRTELQDAIPMQLGQVCGAWAGMFERDRWRLHKVQERIRNIALGGTATGTSFSAPPRYIFAAEQELRKITGLPLSRSQNLPDAVANKDDLAEVASVYRLLSLNLRKMSGDLLLYNFNGELRLPELQYGSTIMPTKVNPVLLEFVNGQSISVEAEAYRIHSYASMGQLQLNAYSPFMISAFLKSEAALSSALKALHTKLFPELQINAKQMQIHLNSSPALLNTLRHLVDYSVIKEILPEYLLQHFHTTEAAAKWLAPKLGLEEEQILHCFDNDS